VRRLGNRRARAIMGEVFPLQEGHVVHHIDGNVLNNNIDNLVVFRNQGDHCRHHRDFEVTPVYP